MIESYVAHFAAAGHFRGDPERAADACWVLTSPQLYAQLAIARSWTLAEFRVWLADMLSATLLRP